MKHFKIILTSIVVLLLFSCKAMNKAAVTEGNIPSNIGNRKYKILVTEIDFNNTISKNNAKAQNNLAKDYVEKKMKDFAEFIPEMEMGKEKYEDRNVYRYALMSETNTKLEKTYTYSNSSRPTEKVTSWVTTFYFYDRLDGKKLAAVGASTTAFWMLKAIVDKINAARS